MRRGDLGRWFRVETILLGVLVSVVGTSATHGKGVRPGEGLRVREGDTLGVLFVGNSYTYYNDLPALLEGMAAAQAEGPSVRVGMVAMGGASLLDHVEGRSAIEAIRSGLWDVVVLQEQSTFGTVHLVDGRYRPEDPEGMWEAGRRLHREVEAAGARPILMEHWRRREAPERDARMIHFAFDRLGRELGVEVAPVGPAFEAAARWGVPREGLYAEDGSHPGPAGSWLAAAVLYQVLTGSAPGELPEEIRGPAVNLETERVVPDSVVVLASLTRGQAARLGAAARAARAAAAAAPAATDPGPPEEPTVPAGAPLSDPGVLEGRWAGPLTVYPYPGTLILDLSRTGGSWSANATITFGGRPDDIRVAVHDLSVRRGEIRFLDPYGPNGGQVRYRGVWTGRGLDGIAEIVVPGTDIHGIGRWSLRRAVGGG
jgi:hypothetical protein